MTLKERMKLMVLNPKKAIKIILLKILSSTSSMWSDELYIKTTYRITFDKKLDLTNPITFNAKLQWLKLYNRQPEYTMMVDKYKVKSYVANKIGEEYIVKTLGVWDRAN